MNKCDKFGNLISLYIDDMLLNSEIEDLLEHLDTCDNCHKYYADLKSTKESLKNLKIEYPENLSQLILDKIQENKEVQIVQYKPPKKKAFYISLVACACVALVISSKSFGFYFTDDNSTQTMSTMETSAPQTMMVEEYDTNSAIADISEPIEESDQIPSNDIQVFNSESISIENTKFLTDELNSTETIPQNTDFLLDDYAFVFEFSGTSELADISGEILYFDEYILYIEVDNTISVIENIIAMLEQNEYDFLPTDQNDFVINAESSTGIFIIHTN